MAKQFVNCLLPGCATVIAASTGEQTPRKYCCAEHRVAARRLRHEVLAGNAAPDSVLPTPLPAVITVKPTPPPRQSVPVPTVHPTTSKPTAQNVDVAHQHVRHGVALSPPSAQRGIELAQQGVERGVEFGRVAATTVAKSCRCCQRLVTHGVAGLRTRWRGATREQRRATVLVGFIAIMLTVSGWAAVFAAGDESTSAQATPPLMSSVTAAPPGMAAWAKQATTDLTAVQHQLGEVTAGESAWNALPATARTGRLANSYTQLEQQKHLLQQEQTMLDTGLGAVADVQQTSRTLDGVKGQLTSVSAMAAGTPPDGPGNSAQTAIHGQLLQQQSVLRQECATLHEELAGWVAAVRVALATGLPGSTDTTIGMVDVMVAASQQTPPPPPSLPAPAPTVVLVDGPTARSRQDVSSSAPPHHHRSSSGSSRRGLPTLSMSGVGDLSDLEQIGFGIVHNLVG